MNRPTKKLNYEVRDSAYIMADGVKKINCLGIDDLGVFVNYLNEDEVVINTSEALLNIRRLL